MEQKKINNFTLNFKVIIVLMFFFLIGANQSSLAQKTNRKSRPALNVDFKLTTFYDDNILKYSKKYITRFLNQEDEGRFHIETYDDIVLSPEIQLSTTFRIIPKRKTLLNAEYRFTHYVVNQDKNRNFLNLGLRQYITGKASIKVAYSYIPYFYVRHFRDDDWAKLIGYIPESFKPFSFAKDNYRFEAQNTFLKDNRLRLALDYAKYYYNGHFTEYDCNNLAYEINLRKSLTTSLNLEIGYTYTQSKAKGYDQTGETRLLSDDADGSYNDNTFLIRVLYDLPSIKKLKHGVDVKCEFGKRYYTSGKPSDIDPLHVQRIDNNILLNGSYILAVSKTVEISAFFNWFYRKADSEIAENKSMISEEKDYNQHQIGLTFTYKLKI